MIDNGSLKENEIRTLDLPMPKGTDHGSVQLKAGGNGRMSWLIRYEDLDWQFRNAAVADMGGYMQVEGLRNEWTHLKEIVIAPLFGANENYLSRTRRVLDFKVYPVNRGNGELRVEVGKCIGGKGTLHFHTPRPGCKLEGSDSVRTSGKFPVVDVEEGTTITIKG